MKRVLFLGTPSYATTILKSLVWDNDIDLIGLVSMEDKAVGRKAILTPPDTKKYIIEHNIDIPILQPKSLKEDGILSTIKELNPDFIVVAAYGNLLPKSILNIAPCINLHASLLPKYRGASPIQASILGVDEYSGITAMLMDEGLDTGKILGYSYLKLASDIKSSELFDKLGITAAVLTLEVIKTFDDILPIAQVDALSSHTKKIKSSDSLVDFCCAKSLYAKFRAYFPWPGVKLEHGLKICDMKILENTSINKKGMILNINEDSSVDIGCTQGSVRIYTLQAPSKKTCNAKSFLMGKRLDIGDILV